MSPSTLKTLSSIFSLFQLSKPMHHALVPDAPEPTIVKTCFCIHAPSQPREGFKLECLV